MAGRKRRTGKLHPSSHCRVTRPRRRQDISTLPEAEQRRLIARAEAVRELLSRTTAEGTIPDDLLAAVAFELEMAPYELLKDVGQFVAYHETYPGEFPANAFTPPLPGKTAKRQQKGVSSSDHAPLQAGGPRRRPHIMSVLDTDERDLLITYAARLAELEQMQRANGGRLPDGELDKAATELMESPDWIEKQVKHLRVYRAAYGSEPDYNDANAFTPLPLGRPRGRMSDPKIVEFVEKAAQNQVWSSLNGDTTTSQISHPIGPRLIHSLVKEVFPDQQSESTTWRIYDDFRQNHPALFAATRGDIDVLQKLLPWIKNKVAGSCERGQLDVRPFPIVVDYGGIHCTVRGLIIVDDYSDYKPVWDVLPAKRMDKDMEALGQDYTCRKIRELLAIAMIRLGRRFRIIYPDNGSIFAKPALGPYMQLLVAPDEDSTILVNRRRKRPRGGGNIENELGSVTRFIQFRPGYILESEYRKSLALGKKIGVRKYEEFIVDYNAYMNYCNLEQIDGQPSCYERFKEGRDRGLSLPSAENLAVFALSSRRELRKADPGGIWLDRKRYVPYRKDARIYEELANAADRGDDIVVRVFDIGDYRMVFFSLDNEITWEFAVDKDADDVVQEQHIRLTRDVEQMMERAGAEAAAFFKTLLSHDDRPLVLNGLRKRARFEALEDAQNDLRVAEAAPNRHVRPQDIGEIQREAVEQALETQADQLSPPASKQQKGSQGARSKPATKRPRRSGQQTPAKPPTEQKPARVVSSKPAEAEIVQLPDDTDEFLRQLGEALGDDMA
jgi:hypothetical protein